jgi:hypothetical protein
MSKWKYVFILNASNQKLIKCTKAPNFVDANGTYWKFYFEFRHFKPPECKLDKYPRLYAIKSNNCINWSKPGFILHANRSISNYSELPQKTAPWGWWSRYQPELSKVPFPKWSLGNIFQTDDGRIWLFFSKLDHEWGFGLKSLNVNETKLLLKNVSLCVFNKSRLAYGRVYDAGPPKPYYYHWYITSKNGKNWSKPVFLGSWHSHTQNLVKSFPGKTKVWILISKNRAYFLRYSKDGRSWSQPKRIKLPSASAYAGYGGKNNLWIAYSKKACLSYDYYTYLIKCDLEGNCKIPFEFDVLEFLKCILYVGLVAGVVALRLIKLFGLSIIVLILCLVYIYRFFIKKRKN